MNIAFACTECDETTHLAVSPSDRELRCASCGHAHAITADAYREGRLTRCLACGDHELFVRKDFSQRLGVAIIVTGFVISTVFWAYYRPWLAYATLFATALLDFALYLYVGNLLECYRCHAQYRGLPELDQFEPFSLEVHEKHRQQKIRMQQAAGNR
jgi:hypothetical protein